MKAASWDDGLTQSQSQAACHKGSHARLLAGPGTGKTVTMTRHILWLLTEENVPPDEILALTFTRVAVAELKNNLKEALSERGISLPKISTLHSFALRAILKNSARVQLPQPVRIADDYEERKIIIEELKELIGNDVRGTRKLLEQLSADWQRLTDMWEKRFPEPRFLGAWQDHRQVYGYTLRSELVYQLKRALEDQPENISIEGPPKYMIIDEYQDLNACDLAVVKSIAELGDEIFCAGDDDQSIYGFRHANPEGIRRFKDDYPGARTMVLDICQRCVREVLDYALYVAKQDVHRLDKSIRAKDVSKPGIVKVLRFMDQDFEADSIAGICQWLVNKKGIPPEEILILLRSDQHNKFSTPIRDALLRYSVLAATVSNPLEPLNSEAGRLLLCYLRLAVNRTDHLAWRTLLGLGGNGIGRETFSKLYDHAQKSGYTFTEALCKVEDCVGLPPTTRNRVLTVHTRVNKFLDDFGTPEGKDLGQWLTMMAEKVVVDDAQRQCALKIFLRVLEITSEESLPELLRALNVSLTGEEQEREQGKVSIMTMHQAKGLSADAVVIPVAEDETIPGSSVGDALADERRLLYVSLTRARRFLFVTYCKQRTGQQRHSGRNSGRSARMLTRFLRGGTHSAEDGEKFVASLV